MDLLELSESRTYAQKLELQLTGALFEQGGIFLEVSADIKNLGAARHGLQREDALRELTAISSDLSERSIMVRAVFDDEDQIEPGEAINDNFLHRLDLGEEEIVWVRIYLGSVECHKSHLVRLADVRGSGTTAL